MKEKLEKPVILEYRRPMPRRPFDQWPLTLAFILTLGLVGVVMLALAFHFRSPLGRMFALVGAVFILLAITIWDVERNW